MKKVSELEKENMNNKSMIKEYKILIILIVFSVIVGLNALILCLKDPREIIVLSLCFGLGTEIFTLVMIIVSLKSEDKWSVIVDFNSKHEGIFELILMVVLITIGIIAIVSIVEFL